MCSFGFRRTLFGIVRGLGVQLSAPREVVLASPTTAAVLADRSGNGVVEAIAGTAATETAEKPDIAVEAEVIGSSTFIAASSAEFKGATVW